MYMFVRLVCVFFHLLCRWDNRTNTRNFTHAKLCLAKNVAGY